MNLDKLWVIGDTHFGHHNILKFTDRYKVSNSITEFDEFLVQQWNSVVPINAHVIHLGDVAFTQYGLSLLDICNGTKTLIMGNHDKFTMLAYLRYFGKVRGCLKIRSGKTTYWFTHVPIHQSFVGQRKSTVAYNIHGHVHAATEQVNSPWYVNVCVDLLPHYKPVKFTSLFKYDNVA